MHRGNPRAMNPQAKMRSADKPYEIWKTRDGSWEWRVLKKWQADDDKPYAKWFCFVKTPMVPEGEMGDVYVKEIKDNAVKTYDEGRFSNNPRSQGAFRERFVKHYIMGPGNTLGEHDPHQHGCKYLGNNAWDCGHIDGLGPDERCDCDWCQGTFGYAHANPRERHGANEAVIYSKGGDNYLGTRNSAPLLFWKEYGSNRNLGKWLYIGYRDRPYTKEGMDQVVVYADAKWDQGEINRRNKNGFLGITAHDLSKPGISPNPIDHYKRLARYMQSNVKVTGPMRTGEYGDATEKRRFRTIGLGAMKQLAKDLGMREFRVDFNPGGPAVSGDVHLYGMFNNKIGLNMFFSKDPWGHTHFGDITYRTIKHMKDYTGGRNQWMHSSEFNNPDDVISKLRAFVEREGRYAS